MLTLATLLKHYKRDDVQEEMIRAASEREAVPRYGDHGFGKRPDVLSNPREILEYVQQGATSFHVSEEHWQNPMLLRTDMNKEEINRLRCGWDLVIDVDCKLWNYAKLITHLIIQELYKHRVASVSVKFSGGKGFHIGVPFAAFPKRVHTQDIQQFFPDGVRRILLYLTERIKPKLSEEIKKEGLDRVSTELGIPHERILHAVCAQCKTPMAPQQKHEFVCAQCDLRIAEISDVAYKTCPRCSTFMQRLEFQQHCKKCKSTRMEEVCDILPLMNMDTVLISSRHLYRMPYSLHEKTGLVSLPIDPVSVLLFEKELASPHHLQLSRFKFLDQSSVVAGEASHLLLEAFDFKPNIEPEESMVPKFTEPEIPAEAIPMDFFPPCIKKGLEGLKDGKKRFLFVLINFLSSVGWGYDQIETVVAEWNQRNPEPLREVIWRGQLRYHQQQQKKILPPNCALAAYYDDLGIRCPAEICGAGASIKNPVQYAKRRVFLHQRDEPKRRKKKKEDSPDSGKT